MSKRKISQKHLKEIVHLDYRTGAFRSRINKRKVKVGDIRGHIKKCKNKSWRWIVGIDGIGYEASSLIWLYVFGRYPTGVIDHINGDPLDNRLSNLREVSVQENSKNLSISTTKSGFTGVRWHKRTGKWKVQIRHGGRSEHLGYFFQLSDAVYARIQKEEEYGFHVNHGLAPAHRVNGCTDLSLIDLPDPTFSENLSPLTFDWPNQKIKKVPCKTTSSELHKAVFYNSHLGEFIRISVPPGQSHRLYKPMGFLRNGYKYIGFQGRSYPITHLIWLYVYGRFPREGYQIDHINQNSSDNRLCNLREVLPVTNLRNKGRYKRSRPTPGIEEISRKRTGIKFKAVVYDRKTKKHKTFRKLEDAVGWRKSELLKLGYSENHNT